jgi:hypothetical protein
MFCTYDHYRAPITAQHLDSAAHIWVRLAVVVKKTLWALFAQSPQSPLNKNFSVSSPLTPGFRSQLLRRIRTENTSCMPDDPTTAGSTQLRSQTTYIWVRLAVVTMHPDQEHFLHARSPPTTSGSTQLRIQPLTSGSGSQLSRCIRTVNTLCMPPGLPSPARLRVCMACACMPGSGFGSLGIVWQAQMPCLPAMPLTQYTMP